MPAPPDAIDLDRTPDDDTVTVLLFDTTICGLEKWNGGVIGCGP